MVSDFSHCRHSLQLICMASVLQVVLLELTATVGKVIIAF